MRLLILGATGPTGRELVSQALEQGHEVTAFARRPEAIKNETVRVVQGDAMRDPYSVAEALNGQDAVVSALGLGKVLIPNRFTERSIGNIVPAMARAGVKRLVWMSSFGVGDTARAAPLPMRLAYSTLLYAVFKDKEAGEAELRKSALDWTIVYPTTLTDGPRTGTYRAGEELKLEGMPSISRADVAHFMLREVVDNAYLRRGVVITS
jgi:putative NADH-flavin reductase